MTALVRGERVVALARLRAVLELCEAHPSLPVPAVGEVCILRTDDVAGQADIEWIAHELRRAGEAPTVSIDGGHIDVIAGDYRAFYISRQGMANYHARMSYVDNVRSDAAPADSAAA